MFAREKLSTSWQECDSKLYTNGTLFRGSQYEEYLDSQGADDGLGVDECGVAEVVEATVSKDLGAGLEPDGLTEGSAVVSQQLWGHDAEGTEHGPASVDHLHTCTNISIRWGWGGRTFGL